MAAEDVSALAGAVWVRGVFAAVFAAVALLCAARLLASRRDASEGGCSTDRSSDASHGVMSLGMAAMVWPWGFPVPALCWQVLFSIAAGWFAVRLLRRVRPAVTPRPRPGAGTDLHHVLGSLAMVYMLAAVPAGHSMAPSMDAPGMGHPGLALPALAWVLVGYFLVFAVRLGAQLAEPASTPAATGPASTGTGSTGTGSTGTGSTGTGSTGTGSTGTGLLGGGPRGVVISPHLLGAGRVVMGIGMSYMLVTML